MDTGKGLLATAKSEDELKKFIQESMGTEGVEQLERGDGAFQEGEVVKLKGSRFRIKSITPKRMILRLLSRQNQTTEKEKITNAANINVHDLASKLSWSAYMTHCLLDDIDFELSEEDRIRLSAQAQEYEKEGARVASTTMENKEMLSEASTTQ